MSPACSCLATIQTTTVKHTHTYTHNTHTHIHRVVDVWNGLEKDVCVKAMQNFKIKLDKVRYRDGTTQYTSAIRGGYVQFPPVNTKNP